MSEIHTILVRARDLHGCSWFNFSIRCQTWPCEGTAEWGNFGEGWPGTWSMVPPLTLDRRPVLGSTVTLNIGNSSGKTSTTVILIGADRADQKTNLGGWLHLVPSGIIPLSVPPNGLQVPFHLQNDTGWIGFWFIFQFIQIDAGASNGVAFSPGLRLLMGQ